MLVPLSWLREYVDFELSPEELADRFDLTGTAVESVEYLGKGLDNVVVGKVEECIKHPNADKLKVCQVDVGEGSLRQIICGAPNVAAGQHVAVALPGAKLPNGANIGKAKLRGIESLGMICSETELALGEGKAGIMVLDDAFKVGTPLVEALDLDEVIFELEVTPNRPDCLSMIGVAREVAAITGGRLRFPEVSFSESERPATDLASIEIRDEELCPRYEARVITGVKVAPSPAWMQRRLERAGIRPISNVVDVTNYVLLETGQPLHAFDYSRLRGGKIVVRRASQDERIVTLDGTERLLSAEELVIADESHAMAIAGIMGGEHSEVVDSTETVLLEAAHFLPESIMRTARKIGLRSESSSRFEKGVDPNGVAFAADRAISLIKELAGGEILKGSVDLYPNPIKTGRLEIRVARVNSILGTSLEAKEIAALITPLGLVVEVLDGEEVLAVSVPTYRFDIEREIDVIEEVARLYGYNSIESTLPEGGDAIGGLTPEQKTARLVKDALVASGLFEVETYSFVDPRDADDMNLASDSSLRNAVKLLNPMSEDQSIMRTMLLPGLVKVIRHNVHREQSSVGIFEVGRAFHPIEGSDLPGEQQLLGIALSGLAAGGEWHEGTRSFDFYDIKGIVENLIRLLGVVDWSLAPVDDSRFHPGRSARLTIAGEHAGVLGELHPLVMEKYDLPYSVIAAELNHGLLVKAMSALREFEEIPKLPAIGLDLALVVDEAVTHETILEIITREGGQILESVRPFDVFRGGAIESGKKSIAYSFVYRAQDRTLTDEEAKESRDKIVARLEREVAAVVRA